MEGQQRPIRSWPRRLADRAVSPYLGRLEAEQRGLREAVEALGRQLAEAQVQLAAAQQRLEALGERAERTELDAKRAARIGRRIYDQEADNRRRLARLRESEEYELAYTEAEPLVSFLIPTYNSYETLRDVALPSVLAQSYANVEVIVVGDSAPAKTAEMVAAVDDPRVRYFNRTIRGPYPEDPAERWFVVGTPPLNDALALARGRWIAVLGDDDAARPDHVERLLATARKQRLEQCYGRLEVSFPSGEALTLGEFPPRLGQWGLQAALYHAGLRFFELELADADYGEPNDWSVCRRMIAAGVRIGMVDDVVVDKNESRRASLAEWQRGWVPRME